MATGSLVVSVTSEFQFPCGIHSPLQANQTSITQSVRANQTYQSTQARTFLLASLKRNVAPLADSWANPTSWTRGQRRHLHRKLQADGLMIRSCLTTSSQWTFDRRRTTSFAPGCLPPPCVHISSTTLHHGKTLRYRVGFLTQTAKKCRSQRATS